MKNYLQHKDKYFKDFSNLMIKQYKKSKFGIASSKELVDPYLIKIRYELAKWQSSGDFCSLSELKLKYRDMICLKNNTCDDLVLVTINNYITNGGAAKEYHVTVASAIWTFQHDLGYNPNVTTTDDAGQEISGVVNYVSDNTLSITFSSPVIGWAYLS